MLRGPVFLMRNRLPLCLAVTASLLLHAALLLVAPPAPVIGKNVPVMTHPVRLRLQLVRPELTAAPAVPEEAPSVTPTPPPPPQQSAAPEGRVEAEPTDYAQSSERYFPRDELDLGPAVLDPPDLGATELGPMLEGRAVLVFYLNEQGGVDRIALEESTLPPAMLAHLEAQRDRITFTPGYKNGIAVKSEVRFEIALKKAAEVNLLGPAARRD